MRVREHPILGPGPSPSIQIYCDGRPIPAVPGEPVAAALMAAGIRVCRYTPRREEPRGVFCALGRCTDCALTLDGVPNVRACVTPARPGMRIEVGSPSERQPPPPTRPSSPPLLPSPRPEGLPTLPQLRASPGYPSPGRLERGPVAILECIQEIPCDPCQRACPRGAIWVGRPITRLPILREEGCDGCGACIPSCPGLAIFVVDMSLPGHALVSIPYELPPLPSRGERVWALDRMGRRVGEGMVVRVRRPSQRERTAVVTLKVERDLGEVVRGMAPKDLSTGD